MDYIFGGRREVSKMTFAFRSNAVPFTCMINKGDRFCFFIILVEEKERNPEFLNLKHSSQGEILKRNFHFPKIATVTETKNLNNSYCVTLNLRYDGL